MTPRERFESSITPRHRNLIVASAAMTFALITMGGIVCVTGSGRGCPDWPGCYGQVVPPPRSDAVIEYIHRFIAGITGLTIIAAAIISWRNSRSIRWVTRPILLAVVLLISVVIYGAFAIITGIPPIVAAIDLGSALLVLALLLTASVAAFSTRTGVDFSSPFAKLSLATTGAAFLVLASSVLVADSGSMSRCLGWPIYGEPISQGDWQSSLGVARRIIALAASVSVIVLWLQAWRRQRGQRAVMSAAAGMGILFIVETVLGALIGAAGQAIYLRVIYVVTTAAFWASLVILTAVAALAEGLPARGRYAVRPTEGRL